MYATKKPGGPWETHEGLPDYHKMVEVVGGYIEYLSIGEGLDLVLNEEGKLHELAPNLLMRVGTQFADVVVGPVLVVRTNTEGEPAGIGPDDVTLLQRLEVAEYTIGYELPIVECGQ